MYYGIDGCSKGWVYIALADQTDEYSFGVTKNIKEFWETEEAKAQQVLIDIPIGISNNTTRPPDMMARKLLKQRASSIFDVPVRQAFIHGAENNFAKEAYVTASKVNQEICGKGFWRQA